MVCDDPKAYDRIMFGNGVFQQTSSKHILLRMLLNIYDDM